MMIDKKEDLFNLVEYGLPQNDIARILKVKQIDVINSLRKWHLYEKWKNNNIKFFGDEKFIGIVKDWKSKHQPNKCIICKRFIEKNKDFCDNHFSNPIVKNKFENTLKYMDMELPTEYIIILCNFSSYQYFKVFIAEYGLWPLYKVSQMEIDDRKYNEKADRIEKYINLGKSIAEIARIEEVNYARMHEFIQKNEKLYKIMHEVKAKLNIVNYKKIKNKTRYSGDEKKALKARISKYFDKGYNSLMFICAEMDLGYNFVHMLVATDSVLYGRYVKLKNNPNKHICKTYSTICKSEGCNNKIAKQNGTGLCAQCLKIQIYGGKKECGICGIDSFANYFGLCRKCYTKIMGRVKYKTKPENWNSIVDFEKEYFYYDLLKTKWEVESTMFSASRQNKAGNIIRPIALMKMVNNNKFVEVKNEKEECDNKKMVVDKDGMMDMLENSKYIYVFDEFKSKMEI